MSFFKAIFDDRDKSVNASHCIAFLLTFSSIAWVTYLVHKNHILPDLSGIAYLLGGSGAMNVANKMEDIVAKFSKKSSDGSVAESSVVVKKIESQ
jgi:hypothetical protein